MQQTSSSGKQANPRPHTQGWAVCFPRPLPLGDLWPQSPGDSGGEDSVTSASDCTPPWPPVSSALALMETAQRAQRQCPLQPARRVVSAPWLGQFPGHRGQRIVSAGSGFHVGKPTFRCQRKGTDWVMGTGYISTTCSHPTRLPTVKSSRLCFYPHFIEGGTEAQRCSHLPEVTVGK